MNLAIVTEAKSDGRIKKKEDKVKEIIIPNDPII